MTFVSLQLAFPLLLETKCSCANEKLNPNSYCVPSRDKVLYVAGPAKRVIGDKVVLAP